MTPPHSPNAATLLSPPQPDPTPLLHVLHTPAFTFLHPARTAFFLHAHPLACILHMALLPPFLYPTMPTQHPIYSILWPLSLEWNRQAGKCVVEEAFTSAFPSGLFCPWKENGQGLLHEPGDPVEEGRKKEGRNRAWKDFE